MDEIKYNDFAIKVASIFSLVIRILQDIFILIISVIIFVLLFLKLFVMYDTVLITIIHLGLLFSVLTIIIYSVFIPIYNIKHLDNINNILKSKNSNNKTLKMFDKLGLFCFFTSMFFVFLFVIKLN